VIRLRFAATLIPLLAFSATPTAAGMIDNPTCKRELAAVVGLNTTLIKLKSPGASPSEVVCAAYRNQFLVAVRARAAVAACMTGSDRENEIGRLDGAVEDINGAIAQSCIGS
jgi:hypothetical protein